MTSTYGWCGKIPKIDLSDLRITELDTMDYADRFLGGRGIATRIYWEEVGPDVSAFDPDNHLILMSGPLGATGAQGASPRWKYFLHYLCCVYLFCYNARQSFSLFYNSLTIVKTPEITK